MSHGTREPRVDSLPRSAGIAALAVLVMLAGLFLLLYAVVRVIVENFREPDAPLTGPFTRGQTLSALLIAGGLCFVVYARKTKQYEAAQSTPSG